MATIVIPLRPVPYHRMTQHSKFSEKAKEYRSWKNSIQFCLKTAERTLPEGHIPLQQRKTLGIQFHLPMPKNWSLKRKSELRGTPHTQRPDLSNLLKALEDALWQEDSVLWYYNHLSKFWNDSGKIIILDADGKPNEIFLDIHR